MRFSTRISTAILIGTVSVLAVVAQNARVEVSKRSAAIPKSCEGVLPASLVDPIDVQSLVKEALCKGAGDVLSDYTYVTTSSKREQDKKGRVKEESTVYEAFFPTLKSGMRARGVLVETSRNGVPVPPAELEKERQRAAERIDKEDEKNARNPPAVVEQDSTQRVGMLPLGSYMYTGINRAAFGMRRGGVTLAIRTFLKTCDLKWARREQVDGREMQIFSFKPRADAQFSENEKYISRLIGEIWIDTQDRIVTRLVGWVNTSPNTNQITEAPSSMTSSVEKPPAVFVEMMRLPKQGIWLPRMTRINGADYPTVFDGITTDNTSIYRDYIRFSTEIKDVKVGAPDKP